MAFIWTRKSYLPTAISILRRLLPVAGWLTLLFSSVVNADLKPYQLEYSITAKGIELTTTRQLQAQEYGWQILQDTDTLLMRLTEDSRFLMDMEKGLINNSYHYKRSVFGNSKEYRLLFSSKDHQAQFQEKNNVEYIDYQQPVYDALNYQLQIRLDLLNNADTFTEKTYPVLEKNRIRNFRFSYTGEENLQTKAGLLRTIKIERVRENQKRKTIIWLAKDWDYIIAKMEHQEDGEPESTLELRRGTLAGRAITGLSIPPDKL